MYKAQLSAAILTLGIAFTGCGGGAAGSTGSLNPPAPIGAPSSAPVSAPTTAPSATPTGGIVTATGFSGDAKQAQVNGKTILVDASTGLALYFFNGDSTNQSNCTAGCLAIWPSHAASASEKGGANFSIFTRSDGNGMQWAFKGRPLYTFVSDTSANNATGNGIQNFVLATP